MLQKINIELYLEINCKNMKYILSIFLLCSATMVFSQGKPFDFMNYRVIGKGNIQSEYGYAQNSLGELNDFDEHFLMLRYGMTDDLELNLSTGSLGYFIGGDGFDLDLLTFGAKYYLFSLMDGSLHGSLGSRITLSFSDEDDYISTIDFALSKRFSSIFSLNTNAGIINSNPYFWLQSDIAVTSDIDVYGKLEYYSLDTDTTDLNIWSIGSRIWISEDIALAGEYGWRNTSLADGNRIKFSLVMRWLD